MDCAYFHRTTIDQSMENAIENAIENASLAAKFELPFLPGDSPFTARLSTFRSAAGSGRVNGVPRPHRCRCQTMIFYTMSPVERIDHVRGSLQLRAETPQRVIRSTPSDLRKFHQLLNNFVVSSDRSFVSTSLQHLPGVLPESLNFFYVRFLS